MNLYQLRNILLQQERAVFSLRDIARLGNIKKNNVPVYMHRMKQKGLLFALEKNKFSGVEDPFIIASQLIHPAYLSLSTALYLHNFLPQIINQIEVITSRRKKETLLFDVKTIFRTISPSRMFGYNKVKKGSSYILLADVEKTIVDCIYFQKYCPLRQVLPALAEANVERLEEYARRFANEGVLRRLGYLLDYSGRAHTLKRSSKVVYALNPMRKKKGTFNKKWYLYVNEVF